MDNEIKHEITEKQRKQIDKYIKEETEKYIRYEYKEKKMKNIEYYTEDILKNKDEFEIIEFLRKHNIYKITPPKPFDIGEALFAFTKWAVQEKPKNALLQWEYDLLTIFNNINGVGYTRAIIVKKLMEKGYFKGIKDTNQTIEEVLENCEVIE